jgi:hypothetical protein
LEKHERISLDQACRIFSNYPICIVKPKSVLKLDGFNEVDKNVRFVSLSDKHFKSWGTNNHLLTTLKFYKLFKKYSHILLYHLDAYAFRDELAFWCSKEFDWIGAVWIDDWSTSAKKIIGVGNGGFSLRRTSTCIKIARRLAILRLIAYSGSWLIPNSKMPAVGRRYYQFLRYLRLFKLKKLTSVGDMVMSPKIFNEDMFWAINVAETFLDFKVADPEDAIKFSFEVHPRYLYKLNNEQLPFGCHAFERYEPDFWKEHISY